MRTGRPTKYDPKYCDDIIKYFSVEKTKKILEKFYYKNGDVKEKEVEVPNELPTIQGFCNSIGIHRDTLNEWTRKHDDFSDSYKKAKQLQEDFWIQNSIRGLYSPAFTIFMGKNVFNWSDRQEIEHSGKMSLEVVSYEDTL